jgi:hypothetical protein
MRSLRAAEPPRLLRSVAIQAAALCVIALLAGLPWVSRQRAPEPQPAPKPVQPEKERRIRVVRIPRPQPVRTETPPPKPVTPPKEPPRATPRPPPPRAAPQQMQAVARPPDPAPRTPAKDEPIAHIEADSTAVKGVPVRVLVPSVPSELAAHLRNSGGCMVVSRLTGDGADVLSVLGIDGSRAVEMPGPPCSGVPKMLRDPTLNIALGDPIGRARAEYGPGDVRLQVILSPALHDRAQSALVARFGPIAQEDMAQKAAAAGYELTCFAEPAGAVRCQ